jgi:hypothetical protein
MMKKLFNLESSYGEVKMQDGKIVISYLWLVLDAKPAEIIPPALTIICMKEFNQKHQLNLGWWVYRGMPIMNATLPQIRAKLALVGRLESFSAKEFFSMTESQWKKLTVQQRHAFDAQAALMCLFLRKEYGQAKFQTFLKYDNFENNILKILGFIDLNKFEETFKRYAANLSADILENKVPDAYLQIEAVEN